MHDEHHTRKNTQEIAHRYITVLLWPVLAAGLFEVAGSAQPNARTLVLFTNAALVIAILWKCGHEHAGWRTASVVGAICGTASTFILALFVLITDFHVARIFNLITQPIFTGVLVGIATGFCCSVLQFIRTQRTRTTHTEKRR